MPKLTPKAVLIYAAAPVVNIYTGPRASDALDDQLLYGQAVAVLGKEAGWVHAAPIDPISGKTGNAGFIEGGDTLGKGPYAPTHKVTALSAPVFSKPNIKSAITLSLSLGAQISCKLHDSSEFLKCELGYVHTLHAAELKTAAQDWVSVAERYENLPYIWGGRSAAGVDCSGLVQNALRAGGFACPRNSGEQALALGAPLNISGGLPELRRGDLVFWQGHVAIMQDGARVLHANGHHMMCISEKLAHAQARIAKAYGPITAVRRLGEKA